MDELFKFMEKHKIATPGAKTFFKENGEILQKSKYAYYVQENDFKHDWCYLPSGLAAIESHCTEGHRTIHSLIEANGYFTGTEHLFSETPHKYGIQFLQRSKILVVPTRKMRMAQEEQAEISKLMHILKQEKLIQLNLLKSIFHERDLQVRYILFMLKMEKLAKWLTCEEIMALLKIGLSTYKDAKRKYKNNEWCLNIDGHPVLLARTNPIKGLNKP